MNDTGLQQACHEDAVQNKRNVVSNQHGGKKLRLVAREDAKNPPNEISFFSGDFNMKFICGNKSNFNPREKSRKQEANKNN